MFKVFIKRIEKLNKDLSEGRLYELVVNETNDKKSIFGKNLISGIGKGLGFGIGFYLITAIIIYTLQYIVKLNIPVIGKYISDIVDIVNTNRR